jgi:hypothetical protein
MEFNTSEFEFSHGHKPRGVGHWAFAITRNPDPEKLYWFVGSYGVAKKCAREFFKLQQPAVIYVQP